MVWTTSAIFVEVTSTWWPNLSSNSLPTHTRPDAFTSWTRQIIAMKALPFDTSITVKSQCGAQLCIGYIIKTVFLAATKQYMTGSVRLSVCPSVRPSVRPSVTPFSPCSHHRIIMKFSGVITMVKSDVHAKGQGQRSKVKVTEVNTQLSRFRTLTPVWIHIWQWNHAHSWKQHRRGALLFFKVIRQISRWHGSKNRRIWPRLVVSEL